MLLLTAPLVSSGIAGQTAARLGIELSYDGNAYRTSDPVSDYITRTSLYLARDFDHGRIDGRFFYGADLNLSAEETDRRSHEHHIGFSATRELTGDGEFVNIGGTFSISRHAEEFDLTNYKQGVGFFSVKVRSHDERIIQLGGRLRYRSYAELPDFTHTEGLFYGRVSFFRTSKTSIILYGSLGLKGYATNGEVEEASGGGSHGHGRGMGSGGAGISSEDASSLVDQMIGRITLGQSLTTTTGVSLSYLRRFSVYSGSHPVYPLGGIWYEQPDDELFNDPYSYEGHDVRAVVTRLLPLNSSARIGYEFSARDYRFEALDLEGNPLPDPQQREDSRHLAWLNLSKTFITGSTPGDIRTFFDYTYIDNRSNDPYFDYTDSVYSFGVDMSF